MVAGGAAAPVWHPVEDARLLVAPTGGNLRKLRQHPLGKFAANARRPAQRAGAKCVCAWVGAWVGKWVWGGGPIDSVKWSVGWSVAGRKPAQT
jgi:hypothetical protein